MLANANRDPKKKSSPFQPADFDPYALMDRRQKGRIAKSDDRLPGDISLLKVFVDRKEGAS